jgi:hypothetical protein
VREEKASDLVGARVQTNVTADDFRVGDATHVEVARAFLQKRSSPRGSVPRKTLHLMEFGVDLVRQEAVALRDVDAGRHE